MPARPDPSERAAPRNAESDGPEYTGAGTGFWKLLHALGVPVPVGVAAAGTAPPNPVSSSNLPPAAAGERPAVSPSPDSQRRLFFIAPVIAASRVAPSAGATAAIHWGHVRSLLHLGEEPAAPQERGTMAQADVEAKAQRLGSVAQRIPVGTVVETVYCSHKYIVLGFDPDQTARSKV